MIKLIVAHDDNDGIGKEGGIPWCIGKDLQWFKSLTTGHAVLMGYKTWSSLSKTVLPNRENIILTKNNYWAIPNRKHLWAADSFDLALVIYHDYIKNVHPEKDLWIIGGSQIYKEALDRNIVDELYISHIYGDYKCDVKCPRIPIKGLDVVSYYKTDKYTHTRFSYTQV